MIATDEDALICDLAEVYHIYNYKSLPVKMVATFSVGLRENSRIKMKMNDMKFPLDTMLLATIVDKLALLVWMQSKDGAEGVNRPTSIVATLLDEPKEKEIVSFSTPEDFERARKEILERSEEKWQQN